MVERCRSIMDPDDISGTASAHADIITSAGADLPCRQARATPRHGSPVLFLLEGLLGYVQDW